MKRSETSTQALKNPSENSMAITFDETGAFELGKNLCEIIAGGLEVAVAEPPQLYYTLNTKNLVGYLGFGVDSQALGYPGIAPDTGLNAGCGTFNPSGYPSGSVNGACAPTTSGTNAGCFQNFAC